MPLQFSSAGGDGAFQPWARLQDLPLWGGDPLTKERIQRCLSLTGNGETLVDDMPFHGGTSGIGIMQLHLAPLVSEAGQVAQIMCLGVDQTALKKLQSDLRTSERRFQDMSHGLPLMVWVSNVDGEQVFANRCFCEFFDITEDEAIGESWAANVHPDDEAYYELYKRCLEQRVSFRRAVRMKNASGQWRYLETFCRPNYNPAGEFTGFIGTSIDMTEQHRVEQRLADADRRKDEFLATLAHELRNPLAPILTGVELIKQISGHSATIDNAIEIIERQSRQMSLLIDDLMDASRVSQGNFELRKHVVQLDDLVREAVDTCRPSIDEAKHKVTMTLPAQPVWVRVDPLRMNQVCTNLLKNACKFTQQQGSIHLSFKESHQGFEIAVTDNGRGFAPDTIDRVFDMYTQLNKRPVNGDVGLGVGLALSKYLVNRHGGSLSVVSDGLNRGSTFKILLPLSLKAEPPLESSEPVINKWVTNERRSDESSRLLAAVTAPSPEILSPGTAVDRPATRDSQSVPRTSTTVPKVLIVDDNEDAAFIISELLEHLGVETLIAHTGAGALTHFSIFEPDMVLLDIGLPDIDGLAVARSIRESGAWGKQVRLVALTGLGSPDDKSKSLKAGFDDHRVKPLSLVHLGPMVQQLKKAPPPVP